MAHIRLTTEIEAAPQVCFDLCLNVDVQLSLDPGMRAVGGVRQGPLQLGDTVTWRSRQFGIPWHMTSRIVEVDRPYRFADKMQRGPFARWHHVHTFQPTATGTRMTDEIEYVPPLGLPGAIFDAAILERHMVRLLRSRNRKLKREAERALVPGSLLRDQHP